MVVVVELSAPVVVVVLLPSSAAVDVVVVVVVAPPVQVTPVPMLLSERHDDPKPQVPHQSGSWEDMVAAELLEGQVTVATDAVPPSLQVTVPVAPAAIVASPSKSQVLGDAEAHFGGLVIQAHLADTLLTLAWRKKTGSKFATAAPNTVATMLRLTAIASSLQDGRASMGPGT